MTNVGAGKGPSVICKEVFDEGYQPSNEGKLIMYLCYSFTNENIISRGVIEILI